MIFADWTVKKYDFSLPFSYKLFGQSKNGTVILLHGFQDHALSMLKRLQWLDRDLPFQVLAVNGPFPVPVWTSEGLREAFAWYFRDTSRNLTIVAPEHTAERLGRLLAELKISNLPTVIFGFSQGGYLAPHLARHLPGIRGIIGLGCGYKLEAYIGQENIPVHAIHGANDQVIKALTASGEHSELLHHGFQGQFHSVEGLDHKIDVKVEPLVRRLAEEFLL